MHNPTRKLIIFCSVAVSLLFCVSSAWSDNKPAPTWNGKPVDQMTPQEVKVANKELNDKIKKGDSSAVQKKANLNNAFDKTPQGQRAKKEDQLEKAKEELEILKKKENAMSDRESEKDYQEGALKRTGDYWEEGHGFPAPPDGNIGPGGDRDRRAAKLRKEQEKARKAKEEARKAAKDLEDKIRKLQDELYVKSGDTPHMTPPETGPTAPSGSATGSSPPDSASTQPKTMDPQDAPEFHWPELSGENFEIQREQFIEPVQTGVPGEGSSEPSGKEKEKEKECPTAQPIQTQ